MSQDDEKATPANYYAPDGYRYGVMFNDGSVGEWFNGRTQREQAEREAAQCNQMFPRDNITVARRRPGGPWERHFQPVKESDG